MSDLTIGDILEEGVTEFSEPLYNIKDFGPQRLHPEKLI